MNINADNYKLVKAYVDIIGIPERAKICEYLDERFGTGADNAEICEDELIRIIDGGLVDGE